MQSAIAQALGLKYAPVAIVFSQEKPANASQFVKGRWGCVMAAFGVVAEKGGVYAFDQDTFGCPGGGVGLGFGNCYTQFIGGLEGFYGFLSNGNGRTEKGRAVAEACSAFLRGAMRDDFLEGERYRKTPELVERFAASVPITQVPARYVLFKPLADVSVGEEPAAVVFLANPDQLSALVILANYARPGCDGATIPHVAGCQAIGICTYQEGKSATPRAVVGLTDISARKMLRRLGRDLMTVSVPLKLFTEMEANVPGSFLGRPTWQALRQES